MKSALSLISKVLAGKLPGQALTYSIRNKLEIWLRTGSKRFEFERLYLENSDPWDFLRSSYEQGKYQRILARILQHRQGTQAVLEIGCSIGIFTKMLSAQFGEIVAIDVAQGAITYARRYCRPCTNVRFFRCDLRNLRLRRKFDVIVCAEVVYYVREDDAHHVCQMLHDHLAPAGIVVLVGEGGGISMSWETRLRTEFDTVQTDTVDDPGRPYRIVILEAAAQH